MNNNKGNNAYNKLTPQRKQLVDAILENLKNGNLFWIQGWKNVGAPISAITGKKYNGINRLFLSLAMSEHKYKDNRWLTYKQMEDKGWTFKRDDEGNNLGKGAGVAIEYFELRDKSTKKPFNKHVLDGMTQDEKQEYFDENIFPMRKYYRVFNGDIIDGIPALERKEIDVNGINERAEKLLQYWSENEAEIIYGGDNAYYTEKTDKVHLPLKEQFVNCAEYYSTALHEVGHSTGHSSRLNRDLSGKFGTDKYAEEELRAELASMFLEQDLEIASTDNHIQNNSAYIQNWHDIIKSDPNALFKAIADADKIAGYVMAKEKEMDKEEEPYAIVEEIDDNGNRVYKIRMAAEYGQTRAILSPFESKDELLKEFGKMQELPYWKGKEFKEVSLDELEEISLKRAEEADAKQERLRQIEEDKSNVYLSPSEIVANALKYAAVVGAVDNVYMTDKLKEKLSRMDDRDVVERASKGKYGNKFTALYNGETVSGDKDKDEQSLMARLAVYCNKDKEQMLRIFKSSGQYNELKPNSAYMSMAENAVTNLTNIDKLAQPQATEPSKKNKFSSFFKR